MIKNPFIEDYSDSEESDDAVYPISQDDRMDFLDRMSASDSAPQVSKSNGSSGFPQDPDAPSSSDPAALTANYTSPNPKGLQVTEPVEPSPVSQEFSTPAPVQTAPPSQKFSTPDSTQTARTSQKFSTPASIQTAPPSTKPVQLSPAFRPTADSTESGTLSRNSNASTQKPTRMTIDGKLVIVDGKATIQGIGTVPEI